jgi:hypothetical protein
MENCFEIAAAVLPTYSVLIMWTENEGPSLVCFFGSVRLKEARKYVQWRISR